jgi:hypothetical protein
MCIAYDYIEEEPILSHVFLEPGSPSCQHALVARCSPNIKILIFSLVQSKIELFFFLSKGREEKEIFSLILRREKTYIKEVLPSCGKYRKESVPQGTYRHCCVLHTNDVVTYANFLVYMELTAVNGDVTRDVQLCQEHEDC